MGSLAKPVVLIVDDQNAIADTLSAILHREGFEAKPVYSGESALEQSAICPDVVVADVLMPGMSGIEMAIRMRERCPSCRILLMSGAAAVAPLLDGARANGHDFEILVKPFHPERLIEWIGRGSAVATQA